MNSVYPKLIGRSIDANVRSFQQPWNFYQTFVTKALNIEMDTWTVTKIYNKIFFTHLKIISWLHKWLNFFRSVIKHNIIKKSQLKAEIFSAFGYATNFPFSLIMTGENNTAVTAGAASLTTTFARWRSRHQATDSPALSVAKVICCCCCSRSYDTLERCLMQLLQPNEPLDY